MNDRELLEKAARAMGYVPAARYSEKTNSLMWFSQSGFPTSWRPLDDDGDALRLAVKLNIDLRFYPDSEITEPWVETAADGGNADEALSPDPYAATRRAIVRAAAVLGETK